MSDFIYVLVTLASFAGLALLVGLIDRRLAAADDLDDPAEAQSLSRETSSGVRA